MDYRQLGGSDLKVPVLSFGTATFGGRGGLATWGNSDVAEATRLIDVCLEAGVNFFDTADVYSDGWSEEILGEAVKGRRDQVLVATKAAFGTSEGIGTSRKHLTEALESSLRRLQTDYVDLYQLHAFDAQTPIEETLETLEEFVQSGKVRYIGCSNFSGWHLMKSLGLAEKHGWTKYISHQAYYSLAGRDFEWDLMPLGIDQNVSTIIWSGLAMGQLTGKIRRGQEIPEASRLSAGQGTPVDREHLYGIVDVLDQIAEETGKSLSQISLNWLLQRPTVASVIIGARNEEQLRDNLSAADWKLTSEQMARLDEASKVNLPYPYWHQQATYAERNPLPV